MAKKLEYDIVTDPSKGIAGLKQFSSAAKRALADVEGSFDETTTSAQKVAKALSGLADEIEADMKGAAKAAEALSTALGPELAGRSNVDSIVADLRKMGLSFDEITADAETLAGSLKDLDRVQMSGIEQSAKRTKAGVDDIGRSADSSKSALANMIGNTTQDLGNMGGVAGSTGVLIGQMGEYMADAALSGEGFASVIKNFAAVAGPAVALGVAIAAVSGFMAEQAAEAEAAAERTEQFGDAMAGAANDTVGLSQALRDNLQPMRDLNSGAEILGSTFAATVNDLGRSIPLLGRMFQDTKVDAVAALDATGMSIHQFSKAINGTEADRAKFIEDLGLFRDAGFITSDQFAALKTATEDYAASVDKARQSQHLMNVDQAEANALLIELLDQRDPMRRLTDQWQTLMDDLADGSVDTKAAAKAINTLAAALGLDPNEVISLALDKVNESAEASNERLDETIDKLKEWADQTVQAMESAAIATADAQVAVDDLASGFNTMARRGEALESMFDLGNAPLDALAATQDINDAIRELGIFIRDEGVPNIFDPNDVDAGPFLDKIESLRDPIQRKVAEAFAAGGPEAAKGVAEGYVTQVTKSLRGKLTKAEVRTLLGLDDIEAKIKLAVDAASYAEATSMLEILTGVGGETPWTAQVKLALAAGEIDANTAKVLIDRQLKDFGVDVPTSLLPPTGADLLAAQTNADNYLKRYPATIPTQTGAPTNVGKTLNDTQRVLDRNPLTVTVLASLRRAFQTFDAGGTVPGGGGLAAERRPEIINGRWLATSPTVVPAGTRVTSGARTARILRTRGLRGLKRYDAGGTVVAGPRTVNVNVNAAVVGNRFDVMRAVRRASLDAERMLGTRG